ncbi:Fe-S cluster assembly protein SufD [Acidiphilium sp. AL]|uniref:Fe-S cluster assembly protein SufD n=1 Tax=Acidiphilium iwatense TaxID=768198 RepID=A0ABS9DVI1_9PROT|nr:MULTISPECIES: Fe-S cluster assembly protein SufD [Acidiphilium]MCF3946742.1 Fe-S cluster assembly protein SufD [Acidiphilium iwatense]MCU4158712.1 Fe-S cluster assembly protein SufD [Acidiphilium sp. AL]
MNAGDFLDRIDLAALPGAVSRRARAAARFRATGWPTRADEAWHYTDLNARLKSFDLALPAEAGSVAGLIPETDLPRIVFVNGRFAEDLSTKMPGLGCYASDAALTEGRDQPMVALNAALAQDGAVLDIAESVDAGTVLLVSIAHAAHQAAIAPRHRIRLGAGAALTLIEIARGEGEYLHNPVVEIALGEGAVLRHYRLQDEAMAAVHVATIFADLASGARYDSFTLNCGARLSRNETHATLAGAKADVHLNAAQLLTGSQHGDITTIVAHDAPNCASRQTVKSVLSGAARGVFQGRIEVARIAQKTDGYQMNQALLLSPDAEIDSKPELEIFADDVKCSHGATIGALDPEQVFYLRSRGIPEAEARAMLIRAFLDEALEPVTDATAHRLFEDAIDAWWRKGVL